MMKTCRTRNSMIHGLLAVLLVLGTAAIARATDPGVRRLDDQVWYLDPVATHRLLSGVVRIATPVDAPPSPGRWDEPVPGLRVAPEQPRLLPPIDPPKQDVPAPPTVNQTTAPDRLPAEPFLRPGEAFPTTPTAPELQPPAPWLAEAGRPGGPDLLSQATGFPLTGRRGGKDDPSTADEPIPFAALPPMMEPPINSAWRPPSPIASGAAAGRPVDPDVTPWLATRRPPTLLPGDVPPIATPVPTEVVSLPQPQLRAPPAVELAAMGPRPVIPRSEWVARGGWWTVSTSGNPFKVVQYEGHKSSYFLDVDHLASSGRSTMLLSASGLDADTTVANFQYLTGQARTGVFFQRFIHRLDHDPLSNIPPSSGSDEIVREDLNAGQDYAIRVQELRTYFKGRWNDKVKYRLNLWLLRKKGMRQAMATQHCATSGPAGPTCHVTSQSQRIDWLTGELEPVIEARLGPVSLAYSRPMRLFSQDDQVVTAPFGDNHVYKFGGIFPYAVTPDSFTQTDRLRAGADLTRYTHLYAQAYHGKTDDKLRDTHRKFYGADLRLTNRRWQFLTWTTYLRANRQLNDLPPFLVDPEGRAQVIRSSVVPPYGLRHPIDYLRVATGVDFSWRPFMHSDYGRGLALTGGVDYSTLSRSYATWQSQNPPQIFDQGKTQRVTYFGGAKMKWRPSFDTFLRYRGRSSQDPLFAVDQYDGATNTNQPLQEDLVTIGGNWIPWPNLIASMSFGLENRRHVSNITYFEEDNYPMTATLWYAPNTRWSFSGGYSYYTNWIDQSILFPSDTPAASTYDRQIWNYGGRAQLLNFGATHRWSRRLSFSGGVELVWTNNSISPLATWPDLNDYFSVGVNKTRYTAGIDWQPNDRVAAYLRYIYQDYDDVTAFYSSGTSNMFLAGLSAFY